MGRRQNNELVKKETNVNKKIMNRWENFGWMDHAQYLIPLSPFLFPCSINAGRIFYFTLFFLIQ